MKPVFAAVMVTLMWPGGVLAQTPEARIEAAIARVVTAGIPVALLEDKLAEGRAKGVSIDRLAIALERRAAGLERAQEALRSRSDISPEDLSAGADALESGVSEKVLQAISELAPRERRAVAIAALDQLVQEGHVSEEALNIVRDALQRGPDALLNLRRPSARAAGAPASVPVGPPAVVPAPGTSPQGGRPAGLPTR